MMWSLGQLVALHEPGPMVQQMLAKIGSVTSLQAMSPTEPNFHHVTSPICAINHSYTDMWQVHRNNGHTPWVELWVSSQSGRVEWRCMGVREELSLLKATIFAYSECAFLWVILAGIINSKYLFLQHSMDKALVKSSPHSFVSADEPDHAIRSYIYLDLLHLCPVLLSSLEGHMDNSLLTGFLGQESC